MSHTKTSSPYWEDIPYSVNIYHRQSYEGQNGVLHVHDVFELLLVLSDGATVYINEERFPVRQNTLLLFNRTDLHCIKVGPGCYYDRYVLYLCAEQIDACSTSQTYLLDCFCRRTSSVACLLPLTDEQLSTLLPLYQQMDDAISQQTEVFGADVLKRSLLCQILVQTNRYYHAYYHLPPFEASMMPQTIYNLLQYIYENYSQELTLTDLADNAYLSTHYLCRLFKQVMGVSPMEYVRNLKLTKAKDLLIKGNSVMSTCEMVGYNNLSNFSRQFKAQIGISPQQYAIQNRNHPL